MAESRARVAIVGAGPVAQALGRALISSGACIVAISSRNLAHAAHAARFINGPSSTPSSTGLAVVDLSQLPRVASHVLIAVADAGIEPVAEVLAAAGMSSGVALHTCGARGPDALQALRALGVACGLLHPLQTIMSAEQGARSFSDVTFGLAGDPPAIEWGSQIAASLHGRWLRIDASRLSYYHAGAVMASNALTAALDAAVALLGKAGIEPAAALQAIAPLARTSVGNALAAGPQAALTGPVVRGDAATVSAHLRVLRDVDPTVARLYEATAAHLLQLAVRRGLSDDRIRALEDAIGQQPDPGQPV